MANTQRDPRKEAFWRDAIGRQASGSLSVREFCKRHGLSEPLFYAWRRTLRERDSQQSPKAPAFLPVIIRDDRRPEHDAGVVIELRGGRRLRLPATMPAGRIAELVQALEATEARA